MPRSVRHSAASPHKMPQASSGTAGITVSSDPRFAIGACACGRDHGELACDAPPPADGTGACGEAAEQAVFRAVFPDDATRRGLLARFGAAAVAGALASAFPLGHAREALAQAGGAPEKKDLKIGFIPITCATPIIMAHPMGFYA